MRKSVFKDDENKFQEEFTLKFKEAYNINPKKTLKFMELCSQELGYNDLDNSLINKMFKFFRVEKNRVYIYCILLLIFGIFSFDGAPFYYFGLVFFLLGILINIFEKKGPSNTIIALFSHGLTGIVLMYFGFSKILFDNLLSSKLYLYMYIASIVCGICGFLRTILYSLSINNVSNKSDVFIFFCLGFLILVVLSIFFFLGVSVNV